MANVEPSANVNVAAFAGWVNATLFIDVAVATPNTGVTNVLPDRVSVPAKVANVPVVGKVTLVAAVAVNVCANAPANVTFPAVERVELLANVIVAALAG